MAVTPPYDRDPVAYGRSADISVASFPAALRRVSWGAIFAGAVVAFAIQFLLTLFGIGLGLSTIEPAREANPLAGLATGTAIYWAVTSIVTAFLGGWIAARLAGIPRATTGALHGAAVWAVMTLAVLHLSGTAAGRVASGAYSVVSGTLGALGNAAEAVLPEVAGAARDVARGEVNVPEGAAQQAEGAAQQAGQALENAAEQAGQAIDRARDDAAAVAGRAADTLAKAAFWAGVASLLGLLAAMIGGAAGRPREIPVTAASVDVR